jgi:hypothetical protein
MQQQGAPPVRASGRSRLRLCTSGCAPHCMSCDAAARPLGAAGVMTFFSSSRQQSDGVEQEHHELGLKADSSSARWTCTPIAAGAWYLWSRTAQPKCC